MKILRAIGHFFAKIGRWIANTAWVQPLLIVGGIFGIIFAIPYIKKGFENLFADDTDEEYAWYEERALGLSEGGRADKLLGYLEEYNDINAKKIKSEFGSKFVLTFVEKNCSNCKESVAAYKYAINNGWVKGFKMYSILVDYEDENATEAKDKYPAKKIYDNHNDLFDQLAGEYGESYGKDDYPLYANLYTEDKSSIVEDLKTKTSQLEGAAWSDTGLQTPTTLLVDLDADAEWAVNGITQVIYNVSQLDFETTTNASTRAMVIRDMWKSEGLFSVDYQG